MAQVDSIYLNCVIYIYKSEHDARAGEQIGGSGFLVMYRFEKNPSHYAVYAVTNNHVINKCSDTVAIRINTIAGGWDVIATRPEDWIRHQNAADIRAIPIKPSLTRECSMIPTTGFLSKERMDAWNIGLGDETFMVGRFVNHEGRQRNTPSLRFGNIAMMPTEPIKDRYGIDQESFLVECRSIPGYSGSPVFVTLRQPEGAPRSEAYGPYGPLQQTTYLHAQQGVDPRGPWLLGVDWCHLSHEEPIFDVQGRDRVKRDDIVAQSNTAMAGVVPAWLLLELLNDEDFMRQREEEDRVITANNKRHHRGIVEDFADDSPTSQKTDAGAKIPIPTQDQFEDVLKKASRKIRP